MNLVKRVFAVAACAAVAGVAFMQTAVAQQTWQAGLGAQSKNLAMQAMAFLPNEMWIHAGDSIRWTSHSSDIHTVSFLVMGQPVLPFAVGCPGFSSSGVTFNGMHCVSAPTLNLGESFTIKFTVPGNYPLICLVHNHMTGVIHVLPASATLPHDQGFYTAQAEEQAKRLLTDTDAMHHHADEGDMDDMVSTAVIPGEAKVTAGTGEMNGTGAGFQSLSVMRFTHGKIKVHAGDTVEWTVKDPAGAHTVTFGTEPANPVPPSSNVTMDADGARHVTLHFVGEDAHSGLLQGATQNRIGVPQVAPGVTVFRVTFLHPGTYDYKCALHDTLGMVGTVTVVP